MRTICPQCDTVLSINHNQVEQRNGMVRCGVCRQVFNALDHMEEEDDYPVLSEENYPSLSSLSENVSSTPTTISPVSTQSSASVHTESADRGHSHNHYNPVTPAVHIHLNQGQASMSREPSIREDEDIRYSEDDPYIGRYHEARMHEDTKDDFFVRDSREYHTYDEIEYRSSSRFPWFLLAVILILLLIGQMFYVFRNQISSFFPATKPYIIQMCGLLQCDVNMHQSVDNISLEQVQLVQDKNRLVQEGEHAFRLQLVLVNKTDLPQEWPILSLSLKNTQGAVTNSRNINPKEYLLSDQVLKPFPAQSRIPINLPFVLSGQMVSNYELNVYYP